MIVGRAVQGAGRDIGGGDRIHRRLYPEEHRTKAMAMVGGSIGMTFAVSLVAAPVLYKLIGMGGIFALTGVLSLLAIGVVLKVVPAAPPLPPQAASFREVLSQPRIVAPEFRRVRIAYDANGNVRGDAGRAGALCRDAAGHALENLSAGGAAFLRLMVPPVFVGEKRGKMKQVFLGAIGLLLLVQVGMWLVMSQPVVHWMLLVALLLAFFIAFNILEAQPAFAGVAHGPAGGQGSGAGRLQYADVARPVLRRRVRRLADPACRPGLGLYFGNRAILGLAYNCMPA